MTLDQDMQWLSSTTPLALFAKWGVPKRSWFAKLLGLRSKPKEIGTLDVEEGALRLSMGMSKPVRVALDEPFTLFLSCQRFPSFGVVEVDLCLRSRTASAATSWLQFRTIWPAEHVEALVPEKQSFAPFISPEHFRRVYLALSGFAQTNADRMPQGLDLDVADDAWSLLESQSELESCVACGSSAVMPIAFETYRCSECGHEGGEGLAEYLLERRRRGFDAMPESERLVSGHKDLLRARDDVRAAQGATIEIQELKARQSQGSSQHSAWVIEGIVIAQERALMSAFRTFQDAAYKLPLQREAILELASRIDGGGRYVAWEQLLTQLDGQIAYAADALPS